MGTLTLAIGPTIVITMQEMVHTIIHAIAVVEWVAGVTGPLDLKHIALKESKAWFTLQTWSTTTRYLTSSARTTSWSGCSSTRSRCPWMRCVTCGDRPSPPCGTWWRNTPSTIGTPPRYVTTQIGTPPRYVTTPSPAITTLCNLMAKHDFDNRYSFKVCPHTLTCHRHPTARCMVSHYRVQGCIILLRFFQAHQSRIATLYLPFIAVILDIKDRLSKDGSTQQTPTTALANGDVTDGSVITRAGQ